MGRAIHYLRKSFRELGRFLRNATIPPENNVAEAALRRVALGRLNYLFFGNEDAGNNFAVLYTLVASCEKNGVNANDYLTDVLTRVSDPPRQLHRGTAPASLGAAGLIGRLNRGLGDGWPRFGSAPSSSPVALVGERASGAAALRPGFGPSSR